MAGVLFQVLTAAILHFNCLNYGMMVALPSSTLEMYLSNQTALHRPMTKTEGSLLGSLASIGALISTPLMGFLLDRLGRKKGVILAAGVSWFSWVLLLLSRRVEMVLVSVFTSGLGAMVFIVVPVFISEFSQDSIRGTLASGAVTFYGLGMLISYLLGGYLQYKTLLYVCTALSSLGLALQMFLKESPITLMSRGQEKEAAKSIAFYRNTSPDSKIVMQELSKIKSVLTPQQVERSPEAKKLTLEGQEKKHSETLSFWQLFKNSPSTKRAFFVSMTLMTAAIFQGMVMVQVYARPLFSEAVPPEVMSPTWCSALLAVVSVVAGLVTAYLTDVVGRRTLMIYASLASGVLCLALGSQINLHWGPHWLTAVFIYLFCATYTMGAGTVPFLLVAELFLPEVKSILSMLVMEWTWLCSFAALFMFRALVAALGLGHVFYIFAGVCGCSAAFSCVCLPETRGRSIHEIQLLFRRKTAL